MSRRSRSGSRICIAGSTSGSVHCHDRRELQPSGRVRDCNPVALTANPRNAIYLARYENMRDEKWNPGLEHRRNECVLRDG